MNLFDITLFGLRRQKLRKAFLALAMVVSLSTVLVLFIFVESQAQTLASQFDEYGANIIVTPKTDDLSLTYGGISLSGIVTNLVEIEAEEVLGIYSIPNSKNIRAVSPKLIGVGPVAMRGNQMDVMLIGVDFAEESKIKAWWQIDGAYPDKIGGAVVGRKAAESIGIEVGDTLKIGEEYLSVTGILRDTGGQDDSAIIAHMSFVEHLLGKQGKVSLVEVSALCSDCPIDDIVEQISAILPNAEVRAIRQVMEQRMQVIRQFSRFSVAVLIILTFMCGLFIFSSVAGAVTERKKEIGIFRAVGFTKWHISKVVISEALLLSMVSGALAVMIALVFARYALPPLTGISTDSVIFNPYLLVAGFTSLLILAFCSSLGPAIKASRVDPVSAIASL